MTIIYSAKCVLCGANEHRSGERIVDGERIPHAAVYYDHNSLTTAAPCDGPFVSVMGRTFQEIRDAADDLKRKMSE